MTVLPTCPYTSIGHSEAKESEVCLLQHLEVIAKEQRFYKIVLFTFPFNQNGQGLYHKLGYRDVGVLENQGILDGEFVDVKIMEKLLNKGTNPSISFISKNI